jgi:hypothetical protein
MAATGGPRIGRPDRLVALHERSGERFHGFRSLTGPPAVTRFLTAPAPVDSPAPKSRRPRMSTSDRLAALLAQREAEDALGLPTGMPAATRLLLAPPSVPVAPPVSPRVIQQRAAELAEQLQPGTTGILRHGHHLPGEPESKDIFVRFSSRNGVWTQEIALRRVGGDWKTATKTHRKVGSAVTQIFAETEEGFPK